MRIIITQRDQPPAIPAEIRDGLVAMPGGQAGALLLPGRINIVTVGSAGLGVKVNAGIPRQEVFARFGFDLLVYPTEGTAFEGFGTNVPETVPNGQNATFTFNPEKNLWRIS
jgi:hypothetical protein